MINAINVGEPIRVPGNFGDTWSATWADDNNLYTSSNDTFCFDIPDFLTRDQVRLFERYWEATDPADQFVFLDQLTPKQKSRFFRELRLIAFNRVEGDDPLNLRGVTVNRMPDYGMPEEDVASMINGVEPEPSGDGRGWKSSGCTFIDGALYWVIARHKYPGALDIPGLRQSAVDASLIKSTDYGKTWTRSVKENVESPMFPGPDFATPWFVEYGPEPIPVDGAERYAYAISNNGFWDNGDTMILGRVARERIGLLDGADWEFYAGGDGSIDRNWVGDARQAQPILADPGKLGSTGAAYLPGRQRYMMIGWHYPGGSGYFRDNSKTTVWDFYEAPKPWGPWQQVHSHIWSPQGYYCPAVCPKFQTDTTVYAVTAGDFKNWWDWYRLTFVPIDFQTTSELP